MFCLHFRFFWPQERCRTAAAGRCTRIDKKVLCVWQRLLWTFIRYNWRQIIKHAQLFVIRITCTLNSELTVFILDQFEGRLTFERIWCIVKTTHWALPMWIAICMLLLQQTTWKLHLEMRSMSILFIIF